MINNVEFPKIIILSISTHGTISDSYTNNPYTIIKIPKKIKQLIKIDVVQYGIANYMNDDELYEYNSIISNNVKNLESKNDIEIEKTINMISNKIKTNIYSNFSNENLDLDYVNYKSCVMTKNNCKIHNYEPDDYIVNKSYSYDKSDTNDKFKNISIYNEGILLNHDLIDYLPKNEYIDANIVNLYEILNFLSEKNVEKIIIFDFSCSLFLPDKNFTQRDIRKYRRELCYQVNLKPIINLKKRKFLDIL